mmetsp:Transcript_19253/g.40139  ORF Transcript_19253/g.40139 Transcript_19253/m.40139 type:complete len:402 (-) Transcript_19253:2526-3731(-)
MTSSSSSLSISPSPLVSMKPMRHSTSSRLIFNFAFLRAAWSSVASAVPPPDLSIMKKRSLTLICFLLMKLSSLFMTLSAPHWRATATLSSNFWAAIIFSTSCLLWFSSFSFALRRGARASAFGSDMSFIPYLSSSAVISPLPSLSISLKRSVILSPLSFMQFSSMISTSAAPEDLAFSIWMFKAACSSLRAIRSISCCSRASSRRLMRALTAPEGSLRDLSPAVSSSVSMFPSPDSSMAEKKSMRRCPFSFMKFSSLIIVWPISCSMSSSSETFPSLSKAITASSIDMSPSPDGSMKRTSFIMSGSEKSSFFPLPSLSFLRPSLSSREVQVPSDFEAPDESILENHCSTVQFFLSRMVFSLARSFLPFWTRPFSALARLDFRKAPSSSPMSMEPSLEGSKY